MPEVSIALTRAVKRLWASYWEMRPTDDPPDLLAVLEDSTPATEFDGYDFTPADGAELWEHPDLPNRAFVVAVQGAEHVVTALVEKRRKKVRNLIERKPLAATRTEHPIADLPPFVPAERVASGDLNDETLASMPTECLLDLRDRCARVCTDIQREQSARKPFGAVPPSVYAAHKRWLSDTEGEKVAHTKLKGRVMAVLRRRTTDSRPRTPPGTENRSVRVVLFELLEAMDAAGYTADPTLAGLVAEGEKLVEGVRKFREGWPATPSETA